MVFSSRVLNEVPFPWLMAVAQLGVGGVWVGLQWLVRLRAAPILDGPALQSLLPLGFYHAAGVALTSLSVGAGSVSFSQIVKAMEPFFSAIMSVVATGKVLHPVVYLTLLPVVGGVSIAVAKELDYRWVGQGVTTSCAQSTNKPQA